MSNIIPKDQETALANEFWDGFDNADLKIPHVSVGQPTTKAEKGKPGHFNYSIGKSVVEVTGVKMILLKKGRVLYAGDGPARCKSDNYYQPSSHIKQPPANDCLMCPLAEWGVNDQKELMRDQLRLKANTDLNKPLCTEGFNILMADENWLPFWFKAQKTQMKVVSEQLLARLRYDFHGKPPYAVSFDMRLRLNEGGGNKYYSCVFENFKAIEDYSMGANLYRALSKRAEDMLARDHEAMDEAHRAKDVSPRTDVPMPSVDEEIPF